MAPKVDPKIIEAMWKAHRENKQWSAEKIRDHLLKEGMKLSADTIRRQLKAGSDDANTSADSAPPAKRAKTTKESNDASTAETAPDIAGALEFMDAFRLGSDAAEIPAVGSATTVLGQRSSSTPSVSSTAKPEKVNTGSTLAQSSAAATKKTGTSAQTSTAKQDEDSTGSTSPQSSTTAVKKAGTGKLNFFAAKGGSSKSEESLPNTPPSRSSGETADVAKMASPPSVEKQPAKSAKGAASQDDFLNALDKLNELSYDDQGTPVSGGGFGTLS